MNNPIERDYERIFRFGQYFVGPDIPDFLDGWPCHELGEDSILACHPRLEVTRREQNGISVTLIGYIVDPLNPAYDNEAILALLTQEAGFRQTPYRATDRFGGRWLIIVDTAEDTLLFADPAGLRQIYYDTSLSADGFVCACEPGLLAKARGLGITDDALAFQNSLGCQQTSEYWWPGDITPFPGIRRLLPNHYLSLKARSAVRYWPESPLQARSVDEVLNLMKERLPALMRAIVHRGPTTASLTAGWDSRMVLAASRDIAQDLDFMTVRQGGMQANHPDLTVPHDLSQALGISHGIIRAAEDASIRPSFRQAFHDSVVFYHEKWLPDAQAIFDAYQQKTTVVVGSMAETGRLFYERALAETDSLTPEVLARITSLGDHPATLAAFGEWLQGLPDAKGYCTEDIFYWEQRAGRWLATSQMEFGLVWKDIFAPFNNRELLVAMLGLDRSVRQGPEYPFFRKLIEEMWHEALSAPINPRPAARKRSIATRVASRIKRLAKDALGGGSSGDRA